MNWILMGIGYMFVDVNAWDLPTLNYLLIQLGCIFLYVAGGWRD